MSGNAPFGATRMYSSQPCSAVCGVAEYAPVFYHVQQEAFVEDAEVVYKEEEEFAPRKLSSPLPASVAGNKYVRFPGQNTRVTYFMNCP